MDRIRLVATALAWMFACCTTAPDESRTVPTIVAVVICAATGWLKNTTLSKLITETLRIVRPSAWVQKLSQPDRTVKQKAKTKNHTVTAARTTASKAPPRQR